MDKPPAKQDAPPASPSVEIEALGRFQVRVDGEPLVFGARGPRKPLVLLKCLIAAGGQDIPAGHLSESVGPDAEGDAAQASFRVALHRLRELLGRDVLQYTGGRLGLNPNLCRLDTQALERDLADVHTAILAEDHTAVRSAALRTLQRYGGPFLSGESEPPEILAARDRLRSLFLRGMAEASGALAEAGDLEDALELGMRTLDVEGAAEPLVRHVLELCGQLGRTTEGLDVYERYRVSLRETLGSEPSPALRAAREALRLAGRSADTASDGPSALRGDRRSPDGQRTEMPASMDGTHGGLPLPDKPSLAVLAFTGAAGDSEHEHLAEAISENIITDLAHVQNLFVIAHASSSEYKSDTVDVRQVGRELGVRYVLEGSVRRDGERMRVSARLIEAANGRHIWAERYDKRGEAFFDALDDISWKVVTELEVNLTEGEQVRGRRRHTTSLAAYDLYSRAISHWRRFSREDNRKARVLLEHALGIDADFADAIGQLGWTHWADARQGWSDSREQSLSLAESLAQRVLAQDVSMALPHSLLAFVYVARRDFDAAMKECRRALDLEPGSADRNALMGALLLWAGAPEQAISYLRTGMRLSPYYPAWHLSTLGDAYRLCGRNGEALDAFRAVIDREPETMLGRVPMVALLVEMGRLEEAQIEARKVVEIDPGFSVSRYGAARLYRSLAETERVLAALRRVGLPE